MVFQLHDNKYYHDINYCHATERPTSIGARVHLELTMIKSRYEYLEAIMVSWHFTVRTEVELVLEKKCQNLIVHC